MKSLQLLLLLSCGSLSPLVAQETAQEPIHYHASFDDLTIPSTMSSLRTLNKTLFNPALYAKVQELWFGNLPLGAKAATDEAQKRWFTNPKDAKAQFDAVCYKKLGPAIESIGPSNLPHRGLSKEELAAPFVSEIEAAKSGEESTKTALSLMILLDQIPRNLYRTNETLGLVYSHYDPIAVSLARHIISTSPRLDLHPSIRHSMPYRQWFYLPLMHSENLSDHRWFSKILDEMKEEFKGDQEVKDSVKHTDAFEGMHAMIVEKFGRYPHRNGCLGRKDTEEETRWLASGGARFGVGG
jgi:uncharacterized protein (DUF924 family)